MDYTQQNNTQTNTETVIETNADAQAILDRMNGKEEEDNSNVDLPSDSIEPKEDKDDGEEKKFANKYNTIDDLKKGIQSIGSELPDAVIDGMSDEALEAYYLDLQKKFSSNKDKKHIIEDDNKEPNEEDKEKTDEKDKPKAVSSELWQELGSTFAEKGGITEEQYKKLNDVGIPNEIVDSYLDGIKAKADNFTRKVYDIAGGEQEFNTVKEWAEENLDASYIEYVSEITDEEKKIQALKGIKAQYDLANGNNAPRRIDGNIGSGRSGGYNSKEAYLADVRDARYQRDKNFRAAVEAKLKRSKL